VAGEGAGSVIRVRKTEQTACWAGSGTGRSWRRARAAEGTGLVW